MSRMYHGTPGHFIAVRKCGFRMHTTVNERWRVSSIGEYRPIRDIEEVGADRLYETMVFDELATDGERWSEIECAGYDTAEEAEAGHEAMCAKYEAYLPAGESPMRRTS